MLSQRQEQRNRASKELTKQQLVEKQRCQLKEKAEALRKEVCCVVHSMAICSVYHNHVLEIVGFVHYGGCGLGVCVHSGYPLKSFFIDVKCIVT